MRIPVFDGAASEIFTALGDDNGLLIVVKRGHIWYPDTGQSTNDWPVKLLVETESGPVAVGT